MLAIQADSASLSGHVTVLNQMMAFNTVYIGDSKVFKGNQVWTIAKFIDFV